MTIMIFMFLQCKTEEIRRKGQDMTSCFFLLNEHFSFCKELKESGSVGGLYLTARFSHQLLGLFLFHSGVGIGTSWMRVFGFSSMESE